MACRQAVHFAEYARPDAVVENLFERVEKKRPVFNHNGIFGFCRIVKRGVYPWRRFRKLVDHSQLRADDYHLVKASLCDAKAEWKFLCP